MRKSKFVIFGILYAAQASWAITDGVYHGPTKAERCEALFKREVTNQEKLSANPKLTKEFVSKISEIHKRISDEENFKNGNSNEFRNFVYSIVGFNEILDNELTNSSKNHFLTFIDADVKKLGSYSTNFYTSAEFVQLKKLLREQGYKSPLLDQIDDESAKKILHEVAPSVDEDFKSFAYLIGLQSKSEKARRKLLWFILVLAKDYMRNPKVYLNSQNEVQTNIWLSEWVYDLYNRFVVRDPKNTKPINLYSILFELDLSTEFKVKRAYIRSLMNPVVQFMLPTPYRELYNRMLAKQSLEKGFSELSVPYKTIVEGIETLFNTIQPMIEEANEKISRSQDPSKFANNKSNEIVTNFLSLQFLKMELVQVLEKTFHKNPDELDAVKDLKDLKQVYEFAYYGLEEVKLQLDPNSEESKQIHQIQNDLFLVNQKLNPHNAIRDKFFGFKDLKDFKTRIMAEYVRKNFGTNNLIILAIFKAVGLPVHILEELTNVYRAKLHPGSVKEFDKRIIEYSLLYTERYKILWEKYHNTDFDSNDVSIEKQIIKFKDDFLRAQTPALVQEILANRGSLNPTESPSKPEEHIAVQHPIPAEFEALKNKIDYLLQQKGKIYSEAEVNFAIGILQLAIIEVNLKHPRFTEKLQNFVPNRGVNLLSKSVEDYNEYIRILSVFDDEYTKKIDFIKLSHEPDDKYEHFYNLIVNMLGLLKVDQDNIKSTVHYLAHLNKKAVEKARAAQTQTQTTKDQDAHQDLKDSHRQSEKMSLAEWNEIIQKVQNSSLHIEQKEVIIFILTAALKNNQLHDPTDINFKRLVNTLPSDLFSNISKILYSLNTLDDFKREMAHRFKQSIDDAIIIDWFRNPDFSKSIVENLEILSKRGCIFKELTGEFREFTEKIHQKIQAPPHAQDLNATQISHKVFKNGELDTINSTKASGSLAHSQHLDPHSPLIIDGKELMLHGNPWSTVQDPTKQILRGGSWGTGFRPARDPHKTAVAQEPNPASTEEHPAPLVHEHPVPVVHEKSAPEAKPTVATSSPKTKSNISEESNKLIRHILDDKKQANYQIPQKAIDLFAKAKNFFGEIESQFQERSHIIEALKLAFITQTSFQMLSDTGAGKTSISELLGEHIENDRGGDNYKYIQLGPNSSLGPILGGFKREDVDKGLMERSGKTSALNSAVVFFDEYYDASMSFLRELMSVFLGRKYQKDGKTEKAQTRLVITASNKYLSQVFEENASDQPQAVSNRNTFVAFISSEMSSTSSYLNLSHHHSNGLTEKFKVSEWDHLTSQVQNVHLTEVQKLKVAYIFESMRKKMWEKEHELKWFKSTKVFSPSLLKDAIQKVIPAYALMRSTSKKLQANDWVGVDDTDIYHALALHFTMVGPDSSFLARLLKKENRDSYQKRQLESLKVEQEAFKSIIQQIKNYEDDLRNQMHEVWNRTEQSQNTIEMERFILRLQKTLEGIDHPENITYEMIASLDVLNDLREDHGFGPIVDRVLGIHP